MPVTPSGFLSKTVDALARTFANSTTFRTVTGSTDATEALTHIFHGRAFDHIEDQVPPRVIIDFVKTETRQEGGVGSGGSLVAVIQIPVGSSYLQSGSHVLDLTKWNDAWMDFLNNVGAIWREVDLLIKSGGYLSGTGTEDGNYGLLTLGRDTNDREDENGDTLAGEDIFFWEIVFNWRGG